MSIDGGYIPGGAYGYVVRQGQYSEPGDDQSLFLTNFAPKGTTIDENGFLVGAEGVIPPKPTTVAPGTGTGAGGAFAEGPSNTPSGNGHISSNGLTAYDNGSTNPDGSLPLTDANGNQIVYKKVTDEYGNTQLVPTGEVIKPVVPPVVDPVVPPVDPVVPPVVNPVAPIVKEGVAYIRTDVDANGNLSFTAYQEVTDANGNVTRRVISLPNTGVTGQFNPSDADRGQTADKDGNLICNNGSRASDCALPTKDANGKPIVYAVDIDSNGNVFLRALVGDAATAAQKTYDFAAQMGGSDAPTVLYSPDFVTYNAIADVVSLSANTLLGTYHERMGTQNTAQIQAEKSSSYNANSWGRLIADNREVAYENAAFNQSIKGTTTGFQLGHSLWQSRNANNALAQAGLAIGYVKGSMDVFGDALLSKQIKTGTIDADTTSLMAYYTLATDKGTYLDAVVQYSYSNATAAGPQSSVALESTGLRGSLEVGIPVRFDALTLEPQAQIIAYKDKFDDAFDSNGYLMSQGDNSGVIVRLGARLTPSDTSSNFKPWFAANVNKQNASTATGVIDKSSNAGLNSEKDSAWADMSVGMSYQVNDSMSVYGHLKQSLAIDSGTNTVTSGAVGVQKSW
jgi:outer membrane autotransporter protein